LERLLLSVDREVWGGSRTLINRQGKNHLGVVFSDTYVVSWKHLLKKTSLRVPQKNSVNVIMSVKNFGQSLKTF